MQNFLISKNPRRTTKCRMLNETCEICCEVKWAPKCTALNNCDKRVCTRCFWEKVGDDPWKVVKCYFCFQEDYRRHLVVVEMYEFFYSTYNKEDPLSEHIYRVHKWESYEKCEPCDKM